MVQKQLFLWKKLAILKLDLKTHVLIGTEKELQYQMSTANLCY